MEIINYEFAKKHLALRLINRKSNAKRLRDIPHKNFLDMAVVVQMFFVSGESNGRSVEVSYQLLDMWGVSFEEVYDEAYGNFLKEESVLSKMQDVLKELGYDAVMGKPAEDMYILTNERKFFGAVHILRTDILDELARKHSSDILVLPSSVHEMILIPVWDAASILETATRLVQNVNQEIVDPKEVLSDHAYLYGLDCGGWGNPG